jgi:hypothetical protein
MDTERLITKLKHRIVEARRRSTGALTTKQVGDLIDYLAVTVGAVVRNLNAELNAQKDRIVGLEDSLRPADRLVEGAREALIELQTERARWRELARERESR